jgi:hypothetical protein
MLRRTVLLLGGFSRSGVAQTRFSGSGAFRSLSPRNRRPWEAGLRYTCYMRNTAVKRGLIAQPGDWPWSCRRFWHPQDRFVLAMDRMP